MNYDEFEILYKINHLSLYQLTIEPNTIFYKKELKIPNDAIIESMESMAVEILNKNNIPNLMS